MIDHQTDRAKLQTYVNDVLRGGAVYRGYKPRTELLLHLAEARSSAEVLVVSAPWCPDCRREVPKMARILETLPATWTVTVCGDDESTRDTLNVRAIPTFIVRDPETGAELGRIIESPRGHNGLEGDLLAIATSAAG